MKKNTLIGRSVPGVALAALIVLAGVALQATPTAPKAPAPAATVLEYKMPAGRTLTYQSKSEETQVMEVMGQSMDTHSTNSSIVTFKSKGPKDKNLLLGVTLDEMAASLTSSAAGDMSPDLSSLKGKAFDMVLSPLGSEVDVAAAEAIKYDYAGATRNISSGFKMFFPDLPDKPVKVGDTWPSNAGVDEDMGEMKMRMDFKNVNTLEGFETVDGMECARVSTAVTGTLTGSGNQQGMDMTFAGTSKGKETWYFAIKEGFYIKSTSETTTEMSIDVPAAGMTIPATATAKSEVKLTAKQ
jgi:hypothetical protein